MKKNGNIGVEIKQKFKDKTFFSRGELYDFFKKQDVGLKDVTFRWRIHQLKKEQVISVISNEFFTLSHKPSFQPQIVGIEKKIYAKIQKQFPTLNYCIWSTQIVNEFMLHLPNKFVTILQVEKEALEPVYSFLKDENMKNVFLQPTEGELQRYVYDSNQVIILDTLVSRAPIQKINNMPTATIEKLIIDLYCDKKLFSAFQGSELIHIVNSAYNRYAIDFTKLFSYAKRRKKDEDMRAFFNKTDIPKEIIHD